MLQTFLPVFAMTFFICLFIVLMQFLWRYIDDLVGKGLDIAVIGELFFYAALTMVPMALPLAILLASLMTFGNLGEKFELTAMKASGVSLIKAMRPLIILIAFIAFGAFFFQNNVLPVAQTKMWTLLYSMRQKSPEMEIPEKAFYDQIPGFNLYVEQKDQVTGMLYDLMIYDMSNGVDNTRIIVADSGRIALTPDKTRLILNIYQGEQFENLRSQTAGVTSYNLPYRRESFERKDIMIPFDANFNRMDESTMRKQYVGKNIEELKASIAIGEARVDSIGAEYAREIKERSYFNISYYTYNPKAPDQREQQRPVTLTTPLDVDSILNHNTSLSQANVLTQALNKAQHVKQDYEFKAQSMKDERKLIRRHDIELQKKFTLSVACLIFFFIGAPLGAIIRKGGIGLPLVVSVILFIIYYIIDNTGYKMAREGRIEVEVGMWISTFVLLPLGIFFTYKAVHDSGVFNLDAYKTFFKKLTGKYVRTLEAKEFTLDEVTTEGAMAVIEPMLQSAQQLSDAVKNLSPLLRPIRRFILKKKLAAATGSLDTLIEYLSNTREHSVAAMLNQYPYTIRPRHAEELLNTTMTLRAWYEPRLAASATSDATQADKAYSTNHPIDNQQTPSL